MFLNNLTDWYISSGSLKKIVDKLYTKSTRFRASGIHQILYSWKSITLKFKILGDSDEIQADSDGVTRKGVTIWTNYVNVCNEYFISFRENSDKPAGTIILGFQRKINPNISDISTCAGKGYTSLIDTTTKKSGYYNINTNIRNTEHEFKIIKTGSTKFQAYFDGKFLAEAEDPDKSFPIGKIGIRTDNIKCEFTYNVEIDKTNFLIGGIISIMYILKLIKG